MPRESQSAGEPLRIGIVGCGTIADIIAARASQCEGAGIAAVASRSLGKSKSFAAKHGIAHSFGDYRELMVSGEVDAVYIATPTSMREELCLAAVDQGLHLLVEKPFDGLASLLRIKQACAGAGLGFMDATHMSHNPRTAKIRQAIDKDLGAAKALRSAFYSPIKDLDNIRYNPKLEPTGAVGDLGWYCFRAISEYFDPWEAEPLFSGAAVRSGKNGAVVRASGVVDFHDGRIATIDVGFDCDCFAMDLDIVGEKGIYSLEDFVHDWRNDLAISEEDCHPGVTLRRRFTPKEYKRKTFGAAKPAAVLMLENFARICKDPAGEGACMHTALSEKTQSLLDGFWYAIKD